MTALTDKGFNVGEPDQIEKKAKQQKTERDRELDDVRAILDTKAGRRLIWRLLGASELFAVSRAMNQSIYALEGKREIGKLIFSDVMEAQPEAYLLMMKESKEGQNHG